MNNIYLCGHTGSINRGCHAIIVSTKKVLEQSVKGNVSAMTFRLADDRRFGLEQIVDLIPYTRKSLWAKGVSVVKRKLLKDGMWGCYYNNKALFSSAKPHDILFNIGGDTYCYEKPYMSFALNNMAEEKGIPTVFWGCSVDDHLMQDEEMQRDINKYSWIVTRETLSYELLKSYLHDQEKLVLACDPAFHLPITEVPLPAKFNDRNTVGINLSPLVFGDIDDETDMMYQNVYCLMDYLIQEMNMHICLIPHVYDVNGNLNDLRILRRIYNRYRNTDRVAIVEEDYDSTQLKYIISRCRFFVGARTHSMIAAYSTGVPALALSYSIKSLGIAKDLLGDEKKYTVNWRSLSQLSQLRDTFISSMINKEHTIRDIYAQILPAYKASIFDAVNKILAEDFK